VSTPLDRYLAVLRDRLPRDASAKENLREIQSHLEQSVSDILATNSGLLNDEAENQAIDRFGRPEEYVPTGPTSVPQRLRTWARQASTRRRRRFAVAGVALLLVVVGAAGALAAFHEEPDRRALFHHGMPLSHYTGQLNETFVVPTGVPALRFSIHSEHESDHDLLNCVNITLTGPTGYNALQAGDSCARIDAEIPAVPGTWTIRLSMRDFTGNLETDVHQSGENNA
jgi:hypothetical protein